MWLLFGKLLLLNHLEFQARPLCSIHGFIVDSRYKWNKIIFFLFSNCFRLCLRTFVLWKFAARRPVTKSPHVHANGLLVLFVKITFHILINYRHKELCWNCTHKQPNRYTQQNYKDIVVLWIVSTFENANLVQSIGSKYHPNVSRRPQKSN